MSTSPRTPAALFERLVERDLDGPLRRACGALVGVQPVDVLDRADHRRAVCEARARFFITLVEDGFSVRSIARMTDHSYNTVYDLIRYRTDGAFRERAKRRYHARKTPSPSAT